MNLGKQVRLQRIFNRETGRAIIVPMDHGVSVGPIEGIENIHKTVSDMADGGADAVARRVRQQEHDRLLRSDRHRRDHRY